MDLQKGLQSMECKAALQVEYQPHLFDSMQIADLRCEFSKVKKSFYIRHNALEAMVRALKEENEFLKSNICKGE